MGAILRVPRSRQHALTTALRVDMAYLCVGVQTVFSLLLAPLFSVIFQGEAYGDGFGYRMGVIMTVFICAMWVLTMAVADLQNGYRLRGIIPASRKSQVAARYAVALRHLGDGHGLGAALRCRAVHQHTQGVVGPLGQTHGACRRSK